LRATGLVHMLWPDIHDVASGQQRRGQTCSGAKAVSALLR
jgi:hypothetical protein